MYSLGGSMQRHWMLGVHGPANRLEEAEGQRLGDRTETRRTHRMHAFGQKPKKSHKWCVKEATGFETILDANVNKYRTIEVSDV
jgi:hypothetical protein